MIRLECAYLVSTSTALQRIKSYNHHKHQSIGIRQNQKNNSLGNYEKPLFQEPFINDRSSPPLIHFIFQTSHLFISMNYLSIIPFLHGQNASEIPVHQQQQPWWSILINKCAFPIAHTQESHLHISTPNLLVNQIIKHQLPQKRSWHL